MSDGYPYLQPGDEVTCDLVNGVMGMHGTVVAVDLDPQGGLRCLSVQADPGLEPVRVRGDAITLWRKGAPIRQAQQVRPAISLPVPAGLPGVPGNHRGR